MAQTNHCDGALLDADAIIKALQSDVADYQGKSGYDGVILGLTVAIVEVRAAAKASRKRDLSVKLTEAERALCKATGAKWLSRDRGGGHVFLWRDQPRHYGGGYSESRAGSLIGMLDEWLFPLIQPEELVEVPDE